MTQERPILFSGDMVRAILEGRKTQTRRVVKPQPVPFGKSGYGGSRQGWNFDRAGINRSWNDDDRDPYRGDPLATAAMRMLCPYGQPGDRLWVRETHFFTRFDCNELRLREHVRYAADGTYCPKRDCVGRSWRPSIFMPRWASRLTLEIVRVRVERLQDISEDDCIAEGIKHDGIVGYYCDEGDPNDPEDIGAHRCNWRAGYAALWDSINAKRGLGWEKNPWVWVIEFTVLHPAQNQFPAPS